MSSHHLSIDDFFVRLADLFESRRKADHGSIFLTQKRLSHGNEDSQSASAPLDKPMLDVPFPDLHPISPLSIIIRATNGKSKDDLKEKVKLSTVVSPDALELFYARYMEICKSGMHGLRKRDRSGRKKAKAKKKKGGAEGEKKL